MILISQSNSRKNLAWGVVYAAQDVSKTSASEANGPG